MKRVVLLTLVFVFCLSLWACDDQTTNYEEVELNSIHLTELLTLSLFFELLEESDVAFRENDESYSWFASKAIAVRVDLTNHYSYSYFHNGRGYVRSYRNFNVYEFDTPEQAMQFTENVSITGMCITGPYSSRCFQPIFSVHWFIRDNVIVFYVGDAPEVLDFFTSLFGQRFAGVDMRRW